MEVKNSMSPGILTISLDFELYWGMRDIVSLEDPDFCKRLEKVYEAIPAMLELFQEYNIHATWAVVGFLYFANRDRLQENLPVEFPNYDQRELSPYKELTELNLANSKFQFCPELIQQVRDTVGQEIGTHTFSHYYCLEPGQTQVEFQADLQAAIEAAKNAQVKTESLIFPRNQYNKEYLATIAKLGLISYRGNENHWLYDWDDGKGNNLNRKLLRLADSYIPLSGYNCYSLEQLKQQYPINLPSSRFLRPYSAKLKPLNPLKLKRITSCLDHAAREKLIYHLWWHPHNFGANLAENISFLGQILEHYQKLAQNYEMQSLNMGEVAQLVLSA